MMISELEIGLRLLVAAVLGAAVGLERERQGQPAGLRTHTILAIGSTLAMTLSINLAMQFQPMVPNGDPARLAAQVVSGIGFLGAGAILRYGTSIKGLTTATSLWTIAIVGLAVGAGHYFSAGAATALMLIILILLNIIEKKFIRTYTTVSLTIEARDRVGIIDEVKAMLKQEGKHVISTSISKDLERQLISITVVLKTLEEEPMESLIAGISILEGIRSFRMN
jgi:putative Mg2+ transporter-C (MgtC) family protein